MHLADAFIQSDLQIAFRLYIFISTCVPWESNPQPFAQLTQWSTTEPHRNIFVTFSCLFFRTFYIESDDQTFSPNLGIYGGGIYFLSFFVFFFFEET